MSKTLERNSDNQKSWYSLKQWRVWATDWYRARSRDIFFSTRVRIILFHIGSVIVIMAITTLLVAYVERATLLAVRTSLQQIAAGGHINFGVFANTNANINDTQIIVFGLILLVGLLTGLIGTRLSLKPVRTALITQRRFIASVAHELRTPLAILKTQNEVAGLDVDTNAPVAEVLRQNVEEIDHITEILNNLLLFNRIDTSDAVAFETVDLGTIIKMVLERLQPLADRKGVRLRFETITIPSIHGNATALEQAFFNLVKNALTYSKRGGEVALTCSAITAQEVTISIVDSGVGIERKDLPHIFEPFFRTQSSQNTERGTGLGLAIVFEIIKLHNGKIQVESTVNVGTRFDITLPRQPHFLRPSVSKHDVSIAYDFSAQQ